MSIDASLSCDQWLLFRCSGARGKYWCIRRFAKGYEVYFGPFGQKGQVVAKLFASDDEAQEEAVRLTRSKVRSGYVEHGFLVEAHAPSPGKVSRARARAHRELDPRYAGYRKVEHAINSGDAQRLRELFGAGVSPDVCSPVRDTPDEPERRMLGTALLSGSPDVVRAFLEAGASLSAADLRSPPLCLAVMNRRHAPELVDLLVDYGADPNERRSDGKAPIHCIAEGYVSVAPLIERLVARGADIDARDGKGWSALHAAVHDRFGNVRATEALIAAGISVDIEDERGLTALEHCRAAARQQKGQWPKLIAILEAAGARRQTSDEREKLLRLLLRIEERRAFRNVPSSMGDAAARGDVHTVALFLADRQDPDEPRRPGWYPIELAKKAGFPEVVELLRAHGAVERGGETQQRAAAIAEISVRRARLESALRAVFAVADPDLAENFGGVGAPEDGERLTEEKDRRAATERAAELIREGCLGARPERTLVGFKPVLVFAAEHGLMPVCQALLDLGVDPNGSPVDDVCTPITWAARSGHGDVVRLLISHGADPSLSRDDRFVPLTEAAQRGDPELVRSLLDAGADPLWTGVANQTALNQAAGPARKAVRRLVRERARPLLEHNKRSVALRARRRRQGPYEPALERSSYDGLKRLVDAPVWVCASPLAEIADTIRALWPSADLRDDVANQCIAATEEFAFLFQLSTQTCTWFSCNSWLRPRRVREWCEMLHRALGSATVLLLWDHDVSRAIDIATGEEHRGRSAMDALLSARGLWLPPHDVSGRGQFYDPGFFAQLTVRGLNKTEVARVDWLDLETLSP